MSISKTKIDGVSSSHFGMELGISSSATIADMGMVTFVVGTSEQMTMFHFAVAVLLQVPVTPLHEALPIDALDLVAEAHARFQAGAITQAMYGRIGMSEGFNYVAGGLPYDMVLRANGVDVFQAIRKDWMHCCSLWIVTCMLQHANITLAKDTKLDLPSHVFCLLCAFWQGRLGMLALRMAFFCEIVAAPAFLPGSPRNSSC